MCHRQNVMKGLYSVHTKEFLCCTRSFFSKVGQHLHLVKEGSGTGNTNSCHRSNYWDMQMMRWIFIVSATFCASSRWCKTPERWRLRLSVQMSQLSVCTASQYNDWCWLLLHCKKFAQIKLRIFDEWGGWWATRQNTYFPLRSRVAQGRRDREGTWPSGKSSMTFEILK